MLCFLGLLQQPLLSVQGEALVLAPVCHSLLQLFPQLLNFFLLRGSLFLGGFQVAAQCGLSGADSLLQPQQTLLCDGDHVSLPRVTVALRECSYQAIEIESTNGVILQAGC